MRSILNSRLYLEDLEKIAEKLDIDELKNKSLLITGGLGLICSAVVDLLVSLNRSHNANVKIYVAARSYEQFENRYGDCDETVYVEYDAGKPIGFDVDVDYIIHGAGVSSPEMYVAKPVETMLSNIDGVHRLLKYAEMHKAKRLLYISSSEVYGKKEKTAAFAEGDFGIINIDGMRASYPVAKKASEMLCKAYTEEYGIDTVVVRPGHIYGPGASSKDRRISSEFAYLAARGQALEMKSSGLQKRSYCYSIDCASAILTALLNGKGGESYNIGHTEVTSIRRMAEILAEVGGVELRMNEPTEAELNSFNPMNNSSLEDIKIKSLGYSDTFSVKEGLEHTVLILKELI